MPRGDVRVELVPPMRGLRSDLPRHLVPDGYLVGGENVLCRDGKVYTRPGFTKLTTTAPTANRLMGAAYYVTHAAARRLVVGTTLGYHLFDGTSWEDVSPTTALTGGAGDQVRFAVFPFAATTRVIAVNDVDAPQVYTGSGDFAALGGSPPIAKCVTVAFQRTILGNVTVSGTRRGSALRVSGFQDPTVWSSDNEVNLTDTQDNIVEVRALNDQVFAIYKDRSQWVGIGAANMFPFVFELKDQQPGPVSPGSVVQAEGVHYYIGQDGDVYRFDGQRCVSIGGAVRRTIQADVLWNQQGRAHGFFDPTYREIWWFWPTFSGPSGYFYGIVYRLPQEDMPGAFSPLMKYTAILTTSTAWRDLTSFGWNDLTGTWNGLGSTYPTWDSFPNLGQMNVVAGTSGGVVYRFGRSGNDDGNSFLSSWDLPFRAPGGAGENFRVDVVEAIFKRPPSAQALSVDIVLLTSDTLGDDGTAVTAQSVSTGSTDKLRATYANTQARFVAVRHRIPNVTAQQEYRGGMLYGWRRGEA